MRGLEIRGWELGREYEQRIDISGTIHTVQLSAGPRSCFEPVYTGALHTSAASIPASAAPCPSAAGTASVGRKIAQSAQRLSGPGVISTDVLAAMVRSIGHPHPSPRPEGEGVHNLIERMLARPGPDSSLRDAANRSAQSPDRGHE